MHTKFYSEEKRPLNRLKNNIVMHLKEKGGGVCIEYFWLKTGISSRLLL
jgi:hypothetical protein